jgi:hypothetical protein
MGHSFHRIRIQTPGRVHTYSISYGGISTQPKLGYTLGNKMARKAKGITEG